MKRWHKYAVAAVIGASVGVVALSNHRAGPAEIYPPGDVTGVTNPQVTQDNIQSTICVTGWTATIRPTSQYTTDLKRQQIVKYNLAVPSTGGTTYDPAQIPTDILLHFEEDHLISLELGGNPTSPQNLWPQRYDSGTTNGGARDKDKLENVLHAMVCSGQMPLAQAQKLIATDWYNEFMALHLDTQSYGGIVNDQDDE